MRTDARIPHRPFTHGLVLIVISLVVGYATITGGALRSKTPAFAAPVTGLSLPGVASSSSPVEQSFFRGTAINKTLRADAPIPAKQQEAADHLAAVQATPTTQPQAVQEDAVVRAASVAPTPPPRLNQVYQVVEGDTVSSIAAHFGLKPEYVLANNAEIRDSDFLKLGQSIMIPAGNGILHEVRLGDTLSAIAARYDVPVTEITAFAANGIATPDGIKEAQLVFVPNGKPLAPAAVALPATETARGGDGAAPAADATAEPTVASVSGGAGSSGGSASARSGDARSSSGLIWPVRGPISSYYGPSHPLGIDIDGFNLAGASVAAATSGTVVFAGGNACCSYGLYVVVMSPGGIETLYGHLNSISVSQGEVVSQGQELGIIGNSGYSTGRHLHFEVIDNGRRANPQNYLP